ncbi:MAG: hypothetical protein IJ571_02540 [Ruminococcus sp.]|nr:hypothetical protein [Ruminococcus sp.]
MAHKSAYKNSAHVHSISLCKGRCRSSYAGRYDALLRKVCGKALVA